MNQQNQHQNPFEDDNPDDFNVLNYLLGHVRGISPSSLTPELAFDEIIDIE